MWVKVKDIQFQNKQLESSHALRPPDKLLLVCPSTNSVLGKELQRIEAWFQRRFILVKTPDISPSCSNRDSIFDFVQTLSDARFDLYFLGYSVKLNRQPLRKVTSFCVLSATKYRLSFLPPWSLP
jgi:hypothetical protein